LYKLLLKKILRKNVFVTSGDKPRSRVSICDQYYHVILIDVITFLR